MGRKGFKKQKQLAGKGGKKGGQKKKLQTLSFLQISGPEAQRSSLMNGGGQGQ